jgi:hypothetical protein
VDLTQPCWNDPAIQCLLICVWGGACLYWQFTMRARSSSDNLHWETPANPAIKAVHPASDSSRPARYHGYPRTLSLIQANLVPWLSTHTQSHPGQPGIMVIHAHSVSSRPTWYHGYPRTLSLIYTNQAIKAIRCPHLKLIRTYRTFKAVHSPLVSYKPAQYQGFPVFDHLSLI